MSARSPYATRSRGAPKPYLGKGHGRLAYNSPKKRTRSPARAERKESDPQAYYGSIHRKRTKKSHGSHKIKGPNRGIVSVWNAPSNQKTLDPERVVSMFNAFYPAEWVLNGSTGLYLDPYYWELNWAQLSKCPVKGTSKGDRLKDEINIHSWKLRIYTTVEGSYTDHTNVARSYLGNHFRLRIIQLLGDEADSSGKAKDAFRKSDFFNVDTASANGPPTNTPIYGYFGSANQPNSKNKYNYKVILDELWPAMTEQHYHEITLGPHIQKWYSTDNAATSVPIKGRFLINFEMEGLNPLYNPRTADIAQKDYSIRVESRVVWSDA